MIWFTSDTHFGHERIIELCDRPFKDADHMNDMLVENWNRVVAPEDTVFHLGDVALGKIDDSLAQVSRLNGFKVLVNGNHDRPFMKKGKPAEADWTRRYEEVFNVVFNHNSAFALQDGTYVNLSHFPYDGDSHGEDRYRSARIADDGKTVLIHGHSHSDKTISYSEGGAIQIHVGVDAHSYQPVSEDQIIKYIEVARELSNVEER